MAIGNRKKERKIENKKGTEREGERERAGKRREIQASGSTRRVHGYFENPINLVFSLRGPLVPLVPPQPYNIDRPSDEISSSSSQSLVIPRAFWVPDILGLSSSKPVPPSPLRLNRPPFFFPRYPAPSGSAGRLFGRGVPLIPTSRSEDRPDRRPASGQRTPGGSATGTRGFRHPTAADLSATRNGQHLGCDPGTREQTRVSEG